MIPQSKYLLFLLLFVCLSQLSFCQHKIIYNEPEDTAIPVDSSFSVPIAKGIVEYEEMDEISGIVASRTVPNALWSHNDSGGKNKLYLINEKAEFLGSLELKDIELRDWEDISIGPGPKAGKSYIYLGEIGDNEAKYKSKFIYRFPEPKLKPGEQFLFKKKIEKIDIIQFRFPDENRDAETLMIDPISKDIYIVSKREEKVNVYVARFPQSTKKVITLEKVGQLHFSKAIAGDISPDGSEILIKNYANIYYWKRKKDESVADALKRKPVRLPYIKEPQGEAIAWKTDASGYFTLSETNDKIPSTLFFYQRKDK